MDEKPALQTPPTPGSTHEFVQVLHQQTQVTDALLGLLWLQYNHEGHMDEDVYAILDGLLMDNRVQLKRLSRITSDSDIPF